MLKLKIDLVVPSWNEFIGKSHWVMVREKKLWAQHLFIAVQLLRSNGLDRSLMTVPAKEKRVVSIVAYRKRLIDRDNLCLKPIMDGLVKCKLLVDDSPKWCEHTIEQKKCEKGQEPYTTIEIRGY